MRAPTRALFTDDLRAWLVQRMPPRRFAARSRNAGAPAALVAVDYRGRAAYGWRRPRLVTAAHGVERRRFIHEHLAETMTLAELPACAPAGALTEYGFRDLVGLSPFKYIKMLRLAEVRRFADEQCRGAAAPDCGFCHLSQFAADYKRVFLESLATGVPPNVPGRRTLPATMPAPSRRGSLINLPISRGRRCGRVFVHAVC
jgi:hypothetical protein